MKLYTRIAMAVVCLSILVVSLLGCTGSKGTSDTGSPTSTVTTLSAPQARTISGKITYDGTINPSHQIIVVASRIGEQSPAYSAVLKQPGTFTLSNVTDAAYSITAFMDLGDDMGSPKPNEPSGYYDVNGDGKGDQVNMVEGKGITQIDIVLHDPK